MRRNMPTRRSADPGARRSARNGDSRASASSRRVMTQTGYARVTHPPDVRVALDAFRHIVQALRVGRAGERHAGLGSAQVFALQQIAEHPDASINDVAALTRT